MTSLPSLFVFPIVMLCVLLCGVPVVGIWFAFNVFLLAIKFLGARTELSSLSLPR